LILFFLPYCCEAAMLEKGVGDHRHKRMTVKALPGSALEVIKTKVYCAEFGFDGDVRNAGYIATWIDLLKTDKRAFFTACNRASKAADHLRVLALGAPAEIAT
jgi:antirestriction protein ArdC